MDEMERESIMNKTQFNERTLMQYLKAERLSLQYVYMMGKYVWIVAHQDDILGYGETRLLALRNWVEKEQ